MKHKLTMLRHRHPFMVTALVASLAAASVAAGVAQLGFVDDLTMAVQGVGTLKGVVQLGQSHVSFPKENDAKSLPSPVAERASLLLYIPNTADGAMSSLTVSAKNGSQSLGSITLNPPSQLPKSDQVNVTDKVVDYSTNAWSVTLPWNWLKPGLQLTLKSDKGLEQVVSGIDFAAPSELVLQHIRIGMLTPPNDPTWLETNPARAAIDYFQKIPVARLVVGQYKPVHLTKVTLANGTVYDNASADQGGVYSGDMREQIGKSLISTGINLANYGVNTSAGTSQSQPGYYMQVVTHHSVGKYANGVQSHGLSGGNGMATLYGTTGNEFSHELGHNYGLGHYPGGSAGSVHTRTTGWGFDGFVQRMIGNINWSSASSSFEGKEIEKFADHPYGFDAMAGGFPMGAVSKYTQHTGYVSAMIQKSLAAFGVVDANSSTGYRKWNAQTKTMDVLADASRRKPATVGRAVATIVGFYDPQQTLPSTIYPPLFGSYGMTYGSQTLAISATSKTCRFVADSGTGTPFVAILDSIRAKAGEMNKFHVNLPMSALPAKVSVQCPKQGAWFTVASADVQKPAGAQPQTTDVGRAASYSAIANSTLTLSSLIETARVPLKGFAALRSALSTALGPIHQWTTNDTNAQAGQLFEYQNPYNSQLDFFLLRQSGAYGYFPTNQSSNAAWTYIGTASDIVNLTPNPLDIHKQAKDSPDNAMKSYYGVTSLMPWLDAGKGTVGDIYVYENPNNKAHEYFMLKTPTYSTFPTNKSSNQNWEYLSDEKGIRSFLDKSDITAFEKAIVAWYRTDRLHTYGETGTRGTIGQVYLYNNPYSHTKDYFRLKTTSYWYFPTNKSSNSYWDYLGSY